MMNAKSILDIIKLGIDKINAILLWLATFLGTWAKIDPVNIHLILIIALSLWASRKIMMLIYSSAEEGRTTTWLIIAGGIFFSIEIFIK